MYELGNQTNIIAFESLSSPRYINIDLEAVYNWPNEDGRNHEILGEGQT